MASKVLVALLLVSSLLSGGCASHPKADKMSPAGTANATLVPKPSPRPAQVTAAPSPAPSPTVPAATPRTPERGASLPSLISEPCAWAPDGKTLIVTRTPSATPVPIFRQAIVLAAVRAALADAPSAPKAAFSHGLLTLTFDRASVADMASAVHRAIAVPEVQKLGVVTGT